MMKKIVVFSIVVILSIATILFYLKPEAESEKTVQQVNPQTTENHQLDKTLVANLDADDQFSKQANSGLTILDPIEPNVVRKLIIPEHFKNVDEGLLFQFDHAALASAQVGDQFPIKMLEFDIHRNAVIQDVEKIDDDIVRWKGKFEAYPEDLNYFTITQSQKDRYAVMKVFTDKGSYSAEILNGVGLALPNVNLEDDGLHSH